jgi:WbqC-like protein family
MSLTVAIMQPYVFPYVGYFCLAEASDIFVFYDDVNYIPRGWINRNRILLNGAPYKFAVPLSNGSQNELIRDVIMHSLADFRQKFLKQLHHAYSKAPCYELGCTYVDAVLTSDTGSIADLAIRSVEEFYKLIGTSKQFLRSSEAFASTRALPKAERLIEIARALNATNYVNAIGGTSLYDKTYFAARGVNLSFLMPHLQEYRQVGSREFVPALSIIDVVMNNSVEAIMPHLRSYELV